MIFGLFIFSTKSKFSEADTGTLTIPDGWAVQCPANTVWSCEAEHYTATKECES